MINSALSSPVYNPAISPKVLKIFQIVNANGYSDDLINQYTQVVINMPTTTIMSGALLNPRNCEVSMATTGIGNISLILETKYQAVVTAGTPTNTYTPTSQQITDLITWTTAYPGFQDTITSVQTGLTTFQTHTDMLIANLPSIIGSMQASIGANTASFGTPDPCAAISQFLGSLQGPGAALMDSLIGIIQSMIPVISTIAGTAASIVAQIQELMALVAGALQSLTQLVQNEVQALVQALIDTARIGLATLLAQLPSDACLSGLMASIGTSALNSILG